MVENLIIWHWVMVKREEENPLGLETCSQYSMYFIYFIVCIFSNNRYFQSLSYIDDLLECLFKPLAMVLKSIDGRSKRNLK